MNIEQLIEAEMAEYSDAAYADHGSARDQLKRFAALVRNEVLEEAARSCQRSDEDGEGPDCWDWHAKDFAAAIRAMKTEVKP